MQYTINNRKGSSATFKEWSKDKGISNALHMKNVTKEKLLFIENKIIIKNSKKNIPPTGIE